MKRDLREWMTSHHVLGARKGLIDVSSIPDLRISTTSGGRVANLWNYAL